MADLPRILFVDDESKVLDGLENLLFSYCDEWEMDFVEGGKAALRKLQNESFDILVTDMRMPGMDGAALLKRVKEDYSHIVRVVLSGHSELEVALETMPLAHQFLSKPCSAEELVAVLRRASDLRSLISSDLVRIVVGAVGALPTRPTVYSKILELERDTHSSLEDVARIIEQDIAISTRVLHISNTAFFSRGTKIETVRQAVPRLGFGFVKDVALSVEVFSGFRGKAIPGFSIEAMHEHALLCGSIAAELLPDRQASEAAFLAGMLHDIGELVFASALPALLAAAMQRCRDDGIKKLDAERQHLGVSHAEAGGYLLGLWGFQYPVIEAVAYHHRPWDARSGDFGVLAAVYLGNIIAHELRTGVPCEEINMGYLDAMGVGGELPEFRARAARIHGVAA